MNKPDSHISNRHCHPQFNLRIVILLALCWGSSVAYAQQPDEESIRSRSTIIDDSTKQIYGPTTSQYFLKENIFSDKWNTYPIDTVIRNFHWFPYVQRYRNLYQDLGNIGTAMRPIYEPVPNALGVRSGFDAYDLYWDAHPVKFYNTRSPYSNMNIILGGKGRSLTNVMYSRNINPRWNFGFHYNGLFIDKQVQRQGKGDRNVKTNYYDLFTSYHTKDSSYIVLASFRRAFHRVFEYGGVRVEDELDYEKLFQENAQPWLTNAESNVLQRNYFLYHQFKVGSALQVYHQFDSDRKQNRFYDDYGAEPNKDFFDAIVIDSALTRDQVNFNTIRNEAGIKGNLLKLFYNGYVVWRNFNMQYKYFSENDLKFNPTGNELYVGGKMELKLDSLVDVYGELETMLDDRYRISGSIKTKWFVASIKRSVFSPSFLQQAYRGSHDEWSYSFSPIEASEIKGNLIYRSSWLQLYPGIRFSTFRNYVFFKYGDYGIDQTVLPIQSSGYQTVASPELGISIMPFKNTTLSAKGIYTKLLENADDAFQIPELFVNAQLAYANIWFGGNFDFQVGLDFHWKSGYKAYGYDPVIQQYYTQQSYQVPDFPLLDVFLSAKIIRGRVFFKYNNLIKSFSNYGNVPTPFYPGVVNTFDFGFDWSFYD